MTKQILILTRGSPLALAQAVLVREALLPNEATIQTLTTTGDAVQNQALMSLGGKGLFTRELDQALLAGRGDVAVHSLKDVPTRLPDGLMLAGVLPREDPRDAFLSPHARSLADLAPGGVIGTASLRRQAQVLNRRPDLAVALLRGNVHTRLAKLTAGHVQGTYLAMAGLNRLGLADLATAIEDPATMLPAIAQGAIGMICREDDPAMRLALAAITCADSLTAVTAERAALAWLDGNCHTPIAGWAQILPDGLALAVEVLTPDGRERWAAERHGSADQPEALGREVAEIIRSQMPDGVRATLAALT